jgi:eukaryotic-like serine/threonine-protein kinase
MKVILEMISGPQKGNNFVFERPEAFVIGRKKNERVQFRIPRDRYLSRYHMLIEVNRAECLLRDLGSTNGTMVNGRPVKTTVLHHGDTLRAGKSKIRVRIEDGPIAEGADGEDSPPANTSPKADWDTRVFGQRPEHAARRELRCMSCGKPATDTHLGGLVDTHLYAHVCPNCMKRHRETDQPIPGYCKLALLQRGELGPVYKARRKSATSADKLVVLKVLAPELAGESLAVNLFLRQMQITARLNHPRIVPVVEMGQAGPDLWIAYEFIDGLDARALAENRGGTLPIEDAVAVTLQVLEALDYAHGRNLVHRDVKPSNILVTGKPGVYEALLGDFGLARNTDEAGVSNFTKKDEIRGTIPFMPPEQVLDCRFVKPAGDLYAAAASLYWMLTGAFVHDFKAVDRRGEVKDPYLIILEDPIVPLRDETRNPAIPEAVARVIETALAREPEDRPESASELALALRKALSTKAPTRV